MAVDISGRWSGKYYYPPKYFVPSFPKNVSLTDTPPVPFEARFEQTGNNIYGEITEENTFAPLGGTILVAEVSGYVAGCQGRSKIRPCGGVKVYQYGCA